MIHTLVLSGGGYYGLITLSILHHLIEKHFLNLETVHTIYGTSIGSLVGTLICLGLSLENYVDYFVNRPWEKSISINGDTIFNYYQNKGLCNTSFFEVMLKNIYESQNFEFSLTMKELYDFSKKELFVYTIELESFTLVEVSYKTHPDLRVIDAVTMSCAIPYIFEPVCYQEQYYIDGGLLCNYPIMKAINRIEEEEQETQTQKQEEGLDGILGIEIKKNVSKSIGDLSLAEYAYFLHCQLCKHQKENQEVEIKHDIKLDCNMMNVENSFKVFYDKTQRENLINIGIQKAEDFLNNNK